LIDSIKFVISIIRVIFVKESWALPATQSKTLHAKIDFIDAYIRHVEYEKRTIICIQSNFENF